MSVVPGTAAPLSLWRLKPPGAGAVPSGLGWGLSVIRRLKPPASSCRPFGTDGLVVGDDMANERAPSPRSGARLDPARLRGAPLTGRLGKYILT